MSTLARVSWLALLALAWWVVSAARVHAYHEPNQAWTSGTAYTLRAGELSLGLIRAEVGVLDELSVGINVMPWVVGPFFGTVIPNGYVKIRDFVHGPFAVALEGHFLYIDAAAILDRVSQGAHSKLLSLMAALSTSMRWSDALSTSLQATFTVVNVGGGSGGLAFEGTAVLDNLFVSGQFEWRFHRTLALHLLGRVLFYREAPTVNLHYTPNATTSVDAALQANFVVPTGAWSVVPALAYSGEHFNMRVGAGYGHRWLPVLGLVLNPGLVVDFDCFVRF